MLSTLGNCQNHQESKNRVKELLAVKLSVITVEKHLHMPHKTAQLRIPHATTQRKGYRAINCLQVFKNSWLGCIAEGDCAFLGAGVTVIL